MVVSIKICGISEEDSLKSAINVGADYIGFVHYSRSPRHLSLEKISTLKKIITPPVKSVIVTVNPADELLTEIAEKTPPDFLQLHGEETARRVTEIKEKCPQIKIIKAIAVRDKEDIKLATDFDSSADIILFDAKPQTGMMHGGNGISFDWSLLSPENLPKNQAWFLSGGLNAGNICEALRLTKARFIDISSGVETSPGVKNSGLIAQFMETVKSCG